MTGKRAEWHVYPPLPRSFLAALPDIPPLLVQCMHNRGVRTAQEMRRFLNGECESTDPFRIKGVADAVTRVRQAVRRGELTAVYGDFDADGVTGTVLLTETLSSLGARVTPYIPHRVDEGYGLHEGAIRTLARQGVTLLITVDCGARAISEVERARNLGIDVIVTDHHSLKNELPAALAVINTRREDCSYPFKGLSGAGIAFKLAQALLLVNGQLPLSPQSTPLEEERLLDLVALGTVADLSPLVDENRSLVKKGLAQLARAQRPGIEAMMEEADVSPDSVTAATIGYVLGPRLNAAGRMDHAMLSFQLLTAASPSRARELARALEEKNRVRRETTTATLEAARLQVSEQEDELVLYAAADDYHEGILGLVAQRLCEEFYRPVIVTKMGKELSVSSARSVDEFDITAALDECASLLQRHGGHAKAAGFTAINENLQLVRTKLSRIAAERLAGTELRPTLDIDAELPLSALKPEHFSLFQQLEPLGAGNPEPLLLSPAVEVRDSRLVGDRHLKFSLSAGNFVWDGIAFGMGDRLHDVAPLIDVVYTPQVRTYRNEEELQLRVEDFRPSPQG
ncbi:MAG TPA: single-stranded-DNA-specific exonuclease RecJ [Anaerolineae bacterium]|nr:single-stranded-DNA-specific exonuclease RecJ [Anaerolineae bacterium]